MIRKGTQCKSEKSKDYVAPKLEVTSFEENDVIMASGIGEQIGDPFYDFVQDDVFN